MEVYEGMYYLLFNAVTDALVQIAEQNYGRAAELLREAQRACEERYIEAE